MKPVLLLKQELCPLDFFAGLVNFMNITMFSSFNLIFINKNGLIHIPTNAENS